jgi:hypothetical protein
VFLRIFHSTCRKKFLKSYTASTAAELSQILEGYLPAITLTQQAAMWFVLQLLFVLHKAIAVKADVSSGMICLAPTLNS